MRSFARRCVAAASLALAAVPALAQDNANENVGVAAAVNPSAVGQPPKKTIEQLVIGQNVVSDERVSTFNKGQVQLVFNDQSTLTLAENSEVIIDKYVFNPRQQTGEMTATVTTGLLRYVGGKISKKSGVEFLTPSGAVTVRGGIALIKVSPRIPCRLGQWPCLGG